MKRLLKVLGYIALILVSLLIIGAVWLFAGDSIRDTWTRWTFEVPTSAHGVSLGDSKSDIIFKRGRSDDCGEPCGVTILIYDAEGFAVFLDDKNRVDGISMRDQGILSEVRLTVPTTEDLIDTLGEPDILVISEDFLERRYTYVKYGASFSYKGNKISGHNLGEFEWGTPKSSPVGEYYINGVQICSGDGCPWDDEGELKPEWKGKTYRDIPLDL